jgi:hypothetical protein
MEIKVKIPDELAAQAKARGIAVEEYVQELLALRASLRSNVGRLRSSEEDRAWLDSLTQFSDKIPQLPEEAFGRESFYQDDESMVIDACLVDTNVLLRIPKRSDPNHPAMDRALSQLATQGTSLCITPIKTSRSFGTR